MGCRACLSEQIYKIRGSVRQAYSHLIIRNLQRFLDFLDLMSVSAKNPSPQKKDYVAERKQSLNGFCAQLWIFAGKLRTFEKN